VFGCTSVNARRRVRYFFKNIIVSYPYLNTSADRSQTAISHRGILLLLLLYINITSGVQIGRGTRAHAFKVRAVTNDP